MGMTSTSNIGGAKDPKQSTVTSQLGKAVAANVAKGGT
jgi:hypothetical protein